MNISNTKLDLDFVRSQFPAFEDPLCKDWSFFENAGGSYVPMQVIERLNNFMISTKVQPYADYPMSKIAGDNMDEAIELFAKMIKANNKEISYIGRNEAASTATGYAKRHVAQQNKIKLFAFLLFHLSSRLSWSKTKLSN